MAVSQRLDLRQAQTLVMTPQLQQAIKLLQLSQVELTAFVDQELEGNPLLEQDESPADGATVVPSEPEPEPEAESSLAAESRAQWAESAGNEGGGNLDLSGDPAAWQSMPSRGSRGYQEFPSPDPTLTRAPPLRDPL